MMDLGRTSVSGTPLPGPEDFAGPGCTPTATWSDIAAALSLLLLHNFAGQWSSAAPRSKWRKIWDKFSCYCCFLVGFGPSQAQSVPGWPRSTRTAWTGQSCSPSSFSPSFRAYKSYKAAVEAGDDGQPNFHARKACDYLKSAVEVIFQFSLWALKFASGLRKHASWRLLHWGRGSQAEGWAGEPEDEGENWELIKNVSI